jgi:hypothetical protein
MTAGSETLAGLVAAMAAALNQPGGGPVRVTLQAGSSIIGGQLSSDAERREFWARLAGLSPGQGSVAYADAGVRVEPPAARASARAEQAGRDGPEPRRDWAVVLYSGDCTEHPGILCAMEAVSPCTLAETSTVIRALPPGFVPHRVSILDPADFLGGPGAELGSGPRAERGDPTGDEPLRPPG